LHLVSHLEQQLTTDTQNVLLTPVNQYHNFVSIHLSVHSYDTSLKLHKNSKEFESKNYFLTTALSFNRSDYELH